MRLAHAGLHVPEPAIRTSALATADFLSTQQPQSSAYAIGEVGLTTALYEAGYTLTDMAPDYVALGETRTYSFDAITGAADVARFPFKPSRVLDSIADVVELI